MTGLRYLACTYTFKIFRLKQEKNQLLRKRGTESLIYLTNTPLSILSTFIYCSIIHRNGKSNKPRVSICQIQQTSWQCAYKTLWGTAIINGLDSPLAYEKSCRCNHNLFACILLTFFSELIVRESYFPHSYTGTQQSNG